MDQSNQALVHTIFQYLCFGVIAFLIMLMTSWNMYISYVEQVEYNLTTGIIQDPNIANCGLRNENYTCDFTFNEKNDGGTYTIGYIPFGLEIFKEHKIVVDYQFHKLY